MQRDRLAVLAFEDDPGDAKLIQRHLEDIFGIDVDFAAFPTVTSEHAAFAARMADLILLDYRLGSETGMEALSKLREAGNRTPVIMLTGQGDERVAHEALACGALVYMDKGALTRASLEQAIRLVLRECADDGHGIEGRECQERPESERAGRHDGRAVGCHAGTSFDSLKEILASLLDGTDGQIRADDRSRLMSLLSGFGETKPREEAFVAPVRERSSGTAASSVAALVEHAVTVWLPVARDKKVQLRTDMGHSLAGAYVNPIPIADVLTRFLGHLLDAASVGQEIRVQVHEGLRASGFVVINVHAVRGFRPGEAKADEDDSEWLPPLPPRLRSRPIRACKARVAEGDALEPSGNVAFRIPVVREAGG